MAVIHSVGEIMQREVVTLGRDDRLDLAEDVMKVGRIRHMPVLDAGRVVGVVSERDLLAASLSRSLEFEGAQRRAFLRSVPASEVMSSDVATVGPGASLEEAARLLIERKVGCLPVVDADGALLGLVTETDLLRAVLLPEASPGEIEVGPEDPQDPRAI